VTSTQLCVTGDAALWVIGYGVIHISAPFLHQFTLAIYEILQ